MITARGGSRISEEGGGGGGAYIKCYAIMYTCLTFFFEWSLKVLGNHDPRDPALHFG